MDTKLLVLAAAALLSACGSSYDSEGSYAPAPPPADPPVAGTQVPTSATTSSAGAFSFANSTASSSSDTSEPLEVGDATLATSETDEPSEF